MEKLVSEKPLLACWRLLAPVTSSFIFTWYNSHLQNTLKGDWKDFICLSGHCYYSGETQSISLLASSFIRLVAHTKYIVYINEQATLARSGHGTLTIYMQKHGVRPNLFPEQLNFL